jgi:ribA/ribD-fused uncharacterized protein
MVQYKIYKSRQCGSTARASDRWTKPQLIDELKASNIPYQSKYNINDMCTLLINKVHNDNTTDDNDTKNQSSSNKTNDNDIKNQSNKNKTNDIDYDHDTNNQYDVFAFYSCSANKEPGKGVYEQLNSNTKYDDLKSINDWRKILSNFYECDFKYKNKTYRTLEHAFHASKFDISGFQKIAHDFALESNSELSKGNGNLARKHRKIATLNNLQLNTWDKVKYDEMFNMFLAKFSQCDLAKKTLFATNNAKLFHIVSRSSNLQHWTHLEKARLQLKNTLIS